MSSEVLSLTCRGGSARLCTLGSLIALLEYSNRRVQRSELFHSQPLCNFISLHTGLIPFAPPSPFPLCINWSEFSPLSPPASFISALSLRRGLSLGSTGGTCTCSREARTAELSAAARVCARRAGALHRSGPPRPPPDTLMGPCESGSTPPFLFSPSRRTPVMTQC